MIGIRRLLGIATLGLLVSCGGGDGGPPAGPVAGDLTVSYFQGSVEAGALLITISGGPVTSVTALGGQQLSSASPFANTTIPGLSSGTVRRPETRACRRVRSLLVAGRIGRVVRR